MTDRRHASIRDLVDRLIEKTAHEGRYPLICLPSMPAAFKLLDACAARGMPVMAVGHPALMEQWWQSADRYMATPLTLWRKCRDGVDLPAVTAIFQDQLVAVDNSYVRVQALGDVYHVSPIECMLITRFNPPCYIGLRVVGNDAETASRLELSTYQPKLQAPLTREDFRRVMADVLRPLAQMVNESPPDWVAGDVFTLKRGNNFNIMLSQQIRQMEALWRLYRRQHGILPDGLPLGNILRNAKAEIASIAR